MNVANTTDCKVGNKYNVLVGFSVTDTACLIMNFVHTTLYEVNNADISRSKKYCGPCGRNLRKKLYYAESYMFILMGKLLIFEDCCPCFSHNI